MIRVSFEGHVIGGDPLNNQVETETVNKNIFWNSPVLDEESLDKNYKIIKNLSKIPDFMPLIKITAFASIGYFSKKQVSLKLICDPLSDVITNISSENSKSAFGCYHPSKEEIHIGALRPEHELTSTWIHEITHFVAQKVFDNDSNPYYKNDTNQEKVKKILVELQNLNKENLLPKVLSDIFVNYDKRNGQDWPSELIARITHLIFTTIYRIKLNYECPVDLNFKSDEVYLYAENIPGETINFYYALKDSTGKIVKIRLESSALKDLIKDLKDSLAIKNRELSKDERRIMTDYFFHKGISVAGDKFIDEMLSKLVKYYKNEFLLECDKYILKFQTFEKVGTKYETGVSITNLTKGVVDFLFGFLKTR